MTSQTTPNPEIQHGLLKVIKALTTMPAQIVFYGSALLAVAATSGAAVPGALGVLATSVGVNVLSSILERVARGDEVPDEEIRKSVEEAISNSGIEKLATSNEFQRAIAHVFRQFDLLKYAVQKGEFTIVAILTDQFAQHKVILEELQSELSIVRGQMETLSTREQSAEILKIVLRILESLEKKLPIGEFKKTSNGKQTLRIFLASPSDLKKERSAVKKIVDEFNEPGGLAELYEINIQLLGWEKAVPNMGNAENVILEQLKVETWDIFVGVIWTRFGSPTGNINPVTGKPFKSGTEEEFTYAYQAWKETGRPHILFYNRNTPPSSLSNIDPEQYRRVVLFMDELRKLGLISTYKSPNDFEDKLRLDLIKLLRLIVYPLVDDKKSEQTENYQKSSVPPRESTKPFQDSSESSSSGNISPSELLNIENELRRLHAVIDTSYSGIMNLLIDEAKDGPRFYSMFPIERSLFNPRQWVSSKFKVVLWCEHTRLPLPIINHGSNLGVYEIETRHEWFYKAAPYLKTTLHTYFLGMMLMIGFLPLALGEASYASIKTSFVASYIVIGLIWYFGIKLIDDLLKDSQWINLSRGAAIRASGAELRELRAFLNSRDPSFGGLVRVLNKRNEFLWVHEKFANEY